MLRFWEPAFAGSFHNSGVFLENQKLIQTIEGSVQKRTHERDVVIFQLLFDVLYHFFVWKIFPLHYFFSL